MQWMTGWWFRGAVLVAMLAASVMAVASGGRVTASPSPHDGGGGWVGTWAASPQALPGTPFSNVTLREIVHVSAGGSMLRVRLDNTFGDQPLTFADVRVARQASGGTLEPDTDQALTFGGSPSVTVAQGGQAFSDPVDLPVPPETNLAVSLYLPGTIGQATGHNNSSQESYVSTPGDHAPDPDASAYQTTIRNWYWLNGVDVYSASTRGSVVALGDSITNGARSTLNHNARWPDYLGARLLTAPSSERRSVLNEGIDGNNILTFRACCGTSVAGLARLDRDVIAQTGVTHVIVLLGTNDIGFQNADAPSIIGGLRQLVIQLQARRLAVIGATVPPFGGSGYYSAHHEAARDAVNEWIRSGEAFEGIVDFDKAIRDPTDPQRMLPAYDSGDHLHPGDAGYHAMAGAVNLKLFR